MTKTYIIAEAGVNHNGSIKSAFKLIDEAVKCGADAVKFQTFKSENLVTPNAKKVNYQKKFSPHQDNQLQMLKNLEISYDEFVRISNYCITKNIDFLSTAFDDDSLNFLYKKIKLKTFKISSGDITNGPFLLSHARKKCKIILSTGMSNISEIESALGVIAYGMLNAKKTNKKISLNKFKQAFKDKKGKLILKKNVSLLHCTSEYPTPYEEVNLLSIRTLQKKFNLDIGYSDHTSGITAAIIATTLGAKIIEKHITLNKKQLGPDHKSSLEPHEFKEMVNQIRITEKCLGNGKKKQIMFTSASLSRFRPVG